MREPQRGAWCRDGTWRVLKVLRKISSKHHALGMAGAEVRRGTATWSGAGQTKQGSMLVELEQPRQDLRVSLLEWEVETRRLF